MKTQVFVYRDILGVITGDKFINEPTASDQLGSVISVDELEITQEAFDWIKSLPREGGSLGDIMVTKYIDPKPYGESSIAFLAGYDKFTRRKGEVKLGRDCTVDAIKKAITTFEIPVEFTSFVDDLLSENKQLTVIKLIVESDDDTLWGRISYNDNLLVDNATSLEELEKKMVVLLLDFHDLKPDSYKFQIEYCSEEGN